MHINPVIAVKDYATLRQIGVVEWENSDRKRVIVRIKPPTDNYVTKGLTKPKLFADRSVRTDLKRQWQSSWRAWQTRVDDPFVRLGRMSVPSRARMRQQSVFGAEVRPKPPGFDLDHVFPVAWATFEGLQVPADGAGRGCSEQERRRVN